MGRRRWSSTVEVAASPPTVRLWPELAFQLHHIVADDKITTCQRQH
jgi:hypothetical protein